MSVYQEGLGTHGIEKAAQKLPIRTVESTPSPEVEPLGAKLGTGVITETPIGYNLTVHHAETTTRSTLNKDADLPTALTELQQAAGIKKLMGVGIHSTEANDTLRKKVWKVMDSVPILLPKDDFASEDTEASAEKIRSLFTEKGTPIIDCDPKTGEIQSSRIATLADWEQSYKDMGQEKFWEESMAKIDHFAKELQGKRLVRINTTAQAGGVAGMLHPAKRFIDEYNAREEKKDDGGHPIDFHWHTMNGHIDPEIAAKHGIDLKDPDIIAKYGNPEKPEEEINVFKITKKMHNIIQAQERPGEEFTEIDKKIHAAWSETQADRLQDVLNQPDTVYWIDDQQPLGLIQRIRENNPDAPVIFRFHIQVRNDMAQAEGSQQKEVINFLMEKMTGDNAVDAFLSHRSKDEEMDDFLPKDAQGKIDPRIADKVMFKVATADTEDGLGKELTENQRAYYLEGINEYLEENGQTPLNMEVGHIGQFARFDRAKNIPGVLASYEKFAEKMMENGTPREDLPEQLVVGFGAVDDPDGEGVLAETKASIAEKYPALADKIKVIRLTYDRFDDRHMKALEDVCDVGLQLSTAEGCEDKITQMLHNGKPMIVANVGGMPPQIIDGINGALVQPHDHETIANNLVDYYTKIYPDAEKREKAERTARETVNPEYTTLANIRDMLGTAALVANQREQIPQYIAEKQKELGRIPFVKEVIDVEYKKNHTQASIPESGVIFANV